MNEGSDVKDDRIEATSVLMDMTFEEYLRFVTGAEQNSANDAVNRAAGPIRALYE